MDPTNAYPKKKLRNWRRQIILEKPKVTVVVDEVVASTSGAEIDVRFHPGVDFQIKDGLVLLTGKEGKMALIPILNQEFSIEQGKHASQFVNATTKFSWIDYFDTKLKSLNNKSLIVTLIVPVEGMEEAEEIAGTGQYQLDDSGNLSVRFMKDDHQFSYDFVNSAKGLVFEK